MKEIRPPRAGDIVEPVRLQTDPIRIQRFGAATHNAHRIHYDTLAARAEGLDEPVVMAQLHGTLFFRAAARYAGDPAAVRSVSWQNRAPAAVGATLIVTGVVGEAEDGMVTLHFEEHDEAGTVCAIGRAVVAAGPPVC
ncbi:MaoC/PaaZ C-terminal domain-containing protein [Nocardia carnea]|uniref:MaoC/PaaZ C-terminal domain-containing protein n=1 Tax=Nocardia carnea TaxID=37328 RepID=UPI002458AF2A|nr:MaoC/PaaZ C-terminal domain-containing protein [Nocardia carnea]